MYSKKLYLFRYCDSRRKVLLEHVHEGYEKEWWDYLDWIRRIFEGLRSCDKPGKPNRYRSEANREIKWYGEATCTSDNHCKLCFRTKLVKEFSLTRLESTFNMLKLIVLAIFIKKRQTNTSRFQRIAFFKSTLRTLTKRIKIGILTYGDWSPYNPTFRVFSFQIEHRLSGIRAQLT